MSEKVKSRLSYYLNTTITIKVKIYLSFRSVSLNNKVSLSLYFHLDEISWGLGPGHKSDFLTFC